MGSVKSKNLQKGLLRKILAYFLTILLSGSLFQISSEIPVQAAPATLSSSYNLVWSDEFDETSLDLNKWQTNAGNNVQSDYATVSDGNLHLKAAKVGPNDYRTGQISTKNKYEFTYGYAEARIKLLNVSASDCAFWLMPHWDTKTNYYSFKGLGGSGTEIDIMEHWYPINDDKVNSAIHWGGYGTNHKVVNGDDNGYWLTPVDNWQTDFHTYAVEWTPTQLDFYVDDTLVYTYTGEGVSNGPEMILLSTGLGDYKNNPVDDAQLPAEALVDYCRVYQKTGDYVTYDDTNPNMTYTGSSDWENAKTDGHRYNSTYHSTQTAGDEMSFTFHGTDAKIIGSKNTWNGTADVYLDGEYKATIDEYSETEAYQQLLYDTKDLTDSYHTIRLVVNDNGSNWFEIDSIQVAYTPPPSSLNTYDDQNPMFTYTGTWTNKTSQGWNRYKETYHSTQTSGDEMNFNFHGTGLKIYISKNGWAGTFDVYLDGEKKASINAKISGNQQYQQVGYEVSGLADSDHTVRVVKTGNNVDWVEIDKVDLLITEAPQFLRTVSGIRTEAATTEAGVPPVLPSEVTVVYSDNTTSQAAVTWDGIDPQKYAKAGQFTEQGTVQITTIPAIAIVTVTKTDNAFISPKTLSFEKGLSDQTDVSTTITWNNVSRVIDIKNGTTPVEPSFYSVNGSTLTISKDYLAAQPIGILPLTIEFDKGNPVTFTIMIHEKTVYYVDSINGNDSNSGTSPDSAWKTLSKVNSVAFGAGDKILFKAGCTWYGQLLPVGSGISGSPIIIDMYGSGNKPEIDAQGATENHGAVVRLYNQEYWEINNLDLKNDANSGEFRAGVLVIAKDYGTANHIYVQNCDIHDIAANFDKTYYVDTMGATNNPQLDIVNQSWANSGGIIFRALKGSATSTATTNFNDILIQGNTVKNVHSLGMGIALSSDWKCIDEVNLKPLVTGPLTPSTNIIMRNNYTENTGWAGCFLGQVDGSVGSGVFIENNTVNRACAFNDGAALWIAYANNVIIQRNEIYDTPNWEGLDCGAIDLDACTRDNVVQYNYTHGNAGEALLLCNATFDTTHVTQYVKNNIIRYNVSVGDGLNCRSVANESVNIDANNPNYFYNNTYYISNVPSSTAYIIHGGSSANVWKNNIFFNDRPGAAYSTQATFDNNVFYGLHPASEPSDANKITSDPMLVNPGPVGYGMSGADAYMLQAGSPSIDSGVSISNSGGKDFWGNLVPLGAADIGANERTASATVSPVTGSFDKNTAAKPADVDTVINWNDALQVTDVRNGTTSLDQSAYSVTDNTLTISKDYLAAQPMGALKLTVVFNTGNTATLTIAISDSTQKAFIVNNVIFTKADGTEITAIPASGIVNAAVNVKNNSADDQTATLIVALYDEGGDIQNLSYITKSIKAAETVKLTAGFKLPAAHSNYKIKVMLWNDLTTMNPISNVVTLQ